MGEKKERLENALLEYIERHTKDTRVLLLLSGFYL